VSEPDDFLRSLEKVVARLERMSVEHKLDEWKGEQEVDLVLDETREILSEVHRWMRERGDEGRFVTLLDAIGRSTAAAEARLAMSEVRLAHVEDMLADGDKTAFKADPKIIAEGEWLREQLAGPSPSHADVAYLKDAPRTRFVSSIDVLRAELAQDVVPEPRHVEDAVTPATRKER
jgi:hypothetical protein